MDTATVKELMIKDLQEIRKNGYVFLSMLFIPILLSVVGIFSSTAILFTSSSNSANSAEIVSLLPDLFTGVIVMIPGIITTLVASTSIVMEKTNHSLEPLLGTPISDQDLFLGKSLAAFLPAMGATYLAFGIYIAGTDVVAYSALGHFILPTTVTYIDMFFLSPAIGLLGTFAALLVSSRVSDVRAAQQVSSMVVLPVLIIVIVPSFITTLGYLFLILFGCILSAVTTVLFFITVNVFQREAILVKWK